MNKAMREATIDKYNIDLACAKIGLRQAYKGNNPKMAEIRAAAIKNLEVKIRALEPSYIIRLKK